MKIKKIFSKQPILLLCIVDTVALTNFLVIFYKMFNSPGKEFVFVLLLIYAIVIALCTFFIFDLYNEQKEKGNFKRKFQSEKDYTIPDPFIDPWFLQPPTCLALYYYDPFDKNPPTVESLIKLTVFAYNHFNIDKMPTTVGSRDYAWMRECFNKGFNNTEILKQINAFSAYFDIDPYIASTRYINYLYQEMFKGTELPKKYKIY